MTTQLSKWGNSRAVRIPKEFLASLGWQEDEEIVMIQDNNAIILKPTRKPLIESLFEGFHGNYSPEEIDWGKPEGNEIW